MFESDFIERFSRVHPAVPAIIYVPVAAAALWMALTIEAVPIRRTATEFISGYLLWTLVEYWLHRLLFHITVVGPRTERLYFLLHGVHHDFPWDRTRLVFPPGASIALCIGVYGLFRLLLGTHAMYGPFAGFLLGYVIYDTTHWYLHAGTPQTALGRWLRREHMIHHFKAPDSRFGVSCPWLDYVFRTHTSPR
jgi:sterol desaturase/sphingolipid hydroxylase (fatty acid hydroxylase superfamily)